jgi:hypothetical protein
MQQPSQRALEAFAAAGIHPSQARRLLDDLERAGVALADANEDEMICRWVNVETQPVPPEADTIIRTITTTVGDRTWSTTHWLQGLRGPRSSQLR